MPYIGGDVDDASVAGGDHRFLRGGARDAEDAVQVDVDLGVELLVGQILSGAEASRSGVVDDDVEAAEGLQSGVDDAVDAGRIAHIAVQDKGLDPELLGDLLGHGLDALDATRHGDDVSSGTGQRLGHLDTDAR